MRMVLFLAMSLTAFFVHARSEPALGRHTVVGLLSMRKNGQARLFVNQMNRGRYTLYVQNADSVVRWMKRDEYTGLVRVQMEVLPPEVDHLPVRILKIVPVHVRRMPVYDGDLVALDRGNG